MSGRKPEIRRLVIRYAAPTLFCVVALFHSYSVLAYDQSLWKGGGFGMFATVDDANARFVKAYRVYADREVPVELPRTLAMSKFLLAPTQEGLAALASAWVNAQSETREQAEDLGNWTGIRLVFWKYHFNGKTNRVLAEPQFEVIHQRRQSSK